MVLRSRSTFLYGGTDVANYSDKNGKDKPVGRKGAVGKEYDAPFRGYVNLQLADADKVAWEKWSASASVWEVLEASVGDGVNIALKLDPKGQGYLASATQRRADSPNAGLVVTARGKEAGVAFTRVLYCLALLGRKERWEDTQPVADPDRW
jgi:hypothetical protein